MGYGVASCWVFCIILSVVSPYCFNYFRRWTFLVFLILTALSSLFFLFYFIETRNKTIEQIRKEFESKTEITEIPISRHDTDRNLVTNHKTNNEVFVSVLYRKLKGIKHND